MIDSRAGNRLAASSGIIKMFILMNARLRLP